MMNRLAPRFKAQHFFARSNNGIVGSNPTQVIDVCVYYLFVFCSCLETY
jgi:hypothetical protein